MDSITVRGNPTAEESSSNGAARQPLAFEELLMRLSARFVNLPADQVDAHIDDGLRQIVAFLGLDRSSFGIFVEGRDLHLTHSYARPGYPPHPLVLMEQQLPWFVGMLLSGRTVRVERAPEGLPEEAVHEREYCRRSGLRAQLTVPIAVGGAPVCAVGVGSFTGPRRWDDRLEARLRLIGEVFASAVARAQLEQARRESEERCRRLRNELAHAGRVTALGEMAASLAHEVNQPLCAILANSRSALRLLDADPPDREEALAALGDIAADAERASQIIARTRSLLRKSEPEYVPLDVNQLVDEVVLLARHELSDRRVAFHLQSEDALPAVRGDRVQLQQVILNLILNAAEAMADVPAAQRDLSVISVAEDGQVRVVVSDRGPGLDPATVDQCFNPFFSTKPGGMGMGLAVCRSIADAHGGGLELLWNEPSGAAFSLCLPAWDARPPA